jgi:hypothetical protein
VACGPWGTAEILQGGREFNPRDLKKYITFAAILAPPATDWFRVLLSLLLLLLLLTCKFNSTVFYTMELIITNFFNQAA